MMKTNLDSSTSRSTTISDEVDLLEVQIDQLNTEISQLREDEVTDPSQESTVRKQPADELGELQEPPLGTDGLGTYAASSASDYDSVSGDGIDASVDTSNNELPTPAATGVLIGPFPYLGQIPVGTHVSYI
jgi:hypothetical protein